MNTVITTNTIEPPETTDASEYSPDVWKGFREHLPKQFRDSLSGTAGDQETINSGCSETDECTYETDETYEIDEIGETGEAEESQEPEEKRRASYTWLRDFNGDR